MLGTIFGIVTSLGIGVVSLALWHVGNEYGCHVPLGGAEKFHSAMVPHGGEQTRSFREVSELGHELGTVPDLAGSELSADVALVMDWPSWWGLELDSHPSVDLTQMDANLHHYAPLFDAGATCDVVHPSWNLSRYRLLVVPNLYMVDAETAGNLAAYVRGGGVLLMSFFSGIVDPHDRVHPGGYPAPFRELLGLWVEEFWPLPEHGTVDVDVDAPLGTSHASGSLWTEWVHLEGAQALATYGSTELAGAPALTRHRYGEGEAWYLATRFDPDAMRALTTHLCDVASVEPALPGLPEGVRATVRRGGDGTSHYILLNHGGGAVDVTLPRAMTDRLAGGRSVRRLRLERRGVAVLTDVADNRAE